MLFAISLRNFIMPAKFALNFTFFIILPFPGNLSEACEKRIKPHVKYSIAPYVQLSE